jgi:hypothetical protein
MIEGFGSGSATLVCTQGEIDLDDYLLTKTMAEQLLNQPKFSYDAGVSCFYHHENDLPNCSQVGIV